MKVCLIFLIYGLKLGLCDDKYFDPEWQATHPWAGQSSNTLPHEEENQRTEYDDLDCLHTNIAFKKLVTFLFGADHFKDTDADGFYHRTINIHITKEQLKKFTKLTKTNDIDGLISEVLAQSKFGIFQAVREHTRNVIHSVFEFNWPHIQKEVPWFTLDNFFKTIALLVAFYASRKFRIRFAMVIFGALLYFLYLHLDYECRKELAVEESLDFIYDNVKNPCAGTSTSWWARLIGSDDRSMCKEHLLKQHNKPNQCDIVSLYRNFFQLIVLKQMAYFFIELANIIKTITVTNGILITIVTLYFMKGLLTTTVYCVFKYILSPSAWFGSGNRATSADTNMHLTNCNGNTSALDTHLTRTLELAHAQAKIMQSILLPNQQLPSGVEIVPSENVISTAPTIDPVITIALATHKKKPLDESKMQSAVPADAVSSDKAIGDTQISECLNSTEIIAELDSSDSTQLSDIETLNATNTIGLDKT